MNTVIEPEKFLEEEIIQEYKNEYMFIGCIDYICQVSFLKYVVGLSRNNITNFNNLI